MILSYVICYWLPLVRRPPWSHQLKIESHSPYTCSILWDYGWEDRQHSYSEAFPGHKILTVITLASALLGDAICWLPSSHFLPSTPPLLLPSWKSISSPICILEMPMVSQPPVQLRQGHMTLVWPMALELFTQDLEEVFLPNTKNKCLSLPLSLSGQNLLYLNIMSTTASSQTKSKCWWCAEIWAKNMENTES